MICDLWDVVVVPFPFTDGPEAKKRPALVISGHQFNESGRTVLTMITSSTRESWPGDAPLTNLTAAGLSVPCQVRMKLFTLDNQLLTRRIGTIDISDRAAIMTQMQRYLFR